MTGTGRKEEKVGRKWKKGHIHPWGLEFRGKKSYYILILTFVFRKYWVKINANVCIREKLG